MKVHAIAEFLGAEVEGDGEIDVASVAALESAGAGQLAFLDSAEKQYTGNASCVIVPPDWAGEPWPVRPPVIIRSGNPKLAFAKAASLLNPPKAREPQIHPTAVIADDAVFGNGVFIGAFACVGEGSVIGDNTQLRAGAKIGDRVSIGSDCVLHPNVFVEDGCSVGNKVLLQTGVVIGSEGFGFVRDETGEHLKFPQIGTVVIEDAVEIGANSCVDRGALGETRIGAGTKIDNLVQVAHNVHIGKRCVIASETGISGSAVIGDDCVIGGQVGIADHVRIESGAIIGARSAVFPGKIVKKGVWAGTPVQPIQDYKRQNAVMRKLGRSASRSRETGSKAD
ncbi:MAG: UDP-3-O-(3-hydroxymyristoyl)glucosamine N-acyltransferase [Pyrinomonadaceae bacterium]|nr:UDP-3-O-(3-hydroxymyristoyl)glucosamine N-acyltransferase [Pyrinomonadaceae bacterium]